MTDEMLHHAALVAAHPDDEILWFSSVIERVDEIILCFQDISSHPEWTIGRRRIVEAFPLPKVSSLGIVESEVFDGADWQAPVTTPYGLAVRKREGLMPGFSDAKYRENFDVLVRRLGERLRPYRNVITHNPWGEYGHEDHVQIYRAVATLAPILGFKVWYSNYCSNKSFHLMLQHLGGTRTDYVSYATNLPLAEKIKTLYQQHGCWTWFDDYQWFNQECFVQDRPPENKGACSHTFPLNYIHLRDCEQRREPDIVRSAVRKFRRAVGA